MARRDLSSELETEDISTSLATDLSISAEDETESEKVVVIPSKQPSRITKQLIERKQLLHDIQLLKVELSQKSLVIDNLKAENMSKEEEMEEKIIDLRHQNQILQAKLEAQINIHHQDAKRRQERLEVELANIISKQRDLERTNKDLQQKADILRESLGDLDITVDVAEVLKTRDLKELSLKEFVSLKFYESNHPLQCQVNDLKAWNKTLEEEADQHKTDLMRIKETLDLEHKAKSELEIRCQGLTLQLADLQANQQQDDYKRENYDKVKSERDGLEYEFLELKKRITYLDVSFKNVAAERDEAQKQFSDQKQELSLLRHDKDYLQKQLADLSSKYAHTEEKLKEANFDLDSAKKSREELYEKYIESRERFKAEYESRLQTELESIRLRTDAEVDKLKASTKDMYDLENRNLKESRDNAILERDRAVASEKDSSLKYEQLLQDFRELQLSMDTKLSNLSSEMRVKNFEAERATMLQDEAMQRLKAAQVENEKLVKKIEVLTKEYYNLQNSSERKITDTESQLSEAKSRLDLYEKMEKELDDVIMQTAEIEDETAAEKVLFSYGYGANVPSTAKRRLQNSMHLARRVLRLERLNTSLKSDLEVKTSQLQQVGEELSNATSLLDQAQQPYNYLIDSIHSRDEQLNKQKKYTQTLEQDIRRLRSELEQLTKINNQMSADLERLLNQREEMAVMKQVVLSLSQRDDHLHHRGLLKIEKLGNHSGSQKLKKGTGTEKPEPTIFTKQEAPRWYEKLTQKNSSQQSKYSTLRGSQQ